jgi:nitrilase
MKIGAVQAAPAFLDKAAGVEKTIAFMEQAALDDVRLLAFPELWLPGYPNWLWLAPPLASLNMVPGYDAQTLSADGPELQQIAAAARRLGINVVLGMAEKDGGSLYMAQAMITDLGTIAVRRKLKPTSAERTLFGEGDGSDLVVQDMGGVRVGALNCWEQIQPLIKQSLFSMGEQVHVGSWPSFTLDPEMAHAMGAKATDAINMVYAIEGQCFVAASTFIMTEEIRHASCFVPGMENYLNLGGGNSAIYAPDGRRISLPLAPDEEGIAVAECDLSMITVAKTIADPSGHYGRPDVLSLHLDAAQKSVLVRSGKGMRTVASHLDITSDMDE